jgi:hypothetical protein
MSYALIIAQAQQPQKKRRSASLKGLKVAKALQGDTAVTVLKAAGILTKDGKLNSKFK